MADLHFLNIRKSFGKIEVLHDITAHVQAGEFVSLLGASGCGKTTLLRIAAGLEGVTSGRVMIGGQDVTGLPPERRDIAMMFQSYALLPHLSVVENIRFPLRMRGIGTREEQRARAAEALETVRLTAYADRRPAALSGGQQQRVALARAIVSAPRVLLLDEALSNLDARLREDMQLELIEIHRKLGLTTLFVTHDQDEALSLSDRVFLMHEGRIEQQGAPADLYGAPQTPYAAGFLGAANLLRAEVADGRAHLPGGAALVLAAGTPSGPATLSIRQEDITVSAPGTGLPAEVRARVYMGARARLVLDLGGVEVKALVAGEAPWRRGDAVSVSVAPERIGVLA